MEKKSPFPKPQVNQILKFQTKLKVGPTQQLMKPKNKKNPSILSHSSSILEESP